MSAEIVDNLNVDSQIDDGEKGDVENKTLLSGSR